LLGLLMLNGCTWSEKIPENICIEGKNLKYDDATGASGSIRIKSCSNKDVVNTAKTDDNNLVVLQISP